MRFRGWLGLAVAVCLYPAHARQLAGCGSHPLKLEEEMFLHRQAIRKRTARPLAPRTASATQDAGNIAVLDASDGVVVTRNQFDLDRRTLTFLPAAPAGYTYQLGDPSYDDAAVQTGEVLSLGDDDSHPVPLAFPFPFFGAVYQQVYVNSDGNLTLQTSDSASTDRSLGRMAGGPARIGPLFDDLDPSRAGGTGSVTVLSEAARLVITWDHIPEFSDFGSGPRQTFQVRLYSDGRIEFAYNGISASSAVVGIAPGALRGASNVLSFLSDPPAVYTSLIAERFNNTVDIDIEAAAQKFYQTHDDAYDYLVFYNSLGIPAGPSAVSWESTVRNHRSGYGGVQVEAGAEFGSSARLQAVLNMGPLNQFPTNPKGSVPARASTGDTPVTVLAHEAGHLFLAYASVRDPDNPDAKPMLGYQGAHWVFNFNSDASLLEGNRIRDGGAGTSPEFTTVGTVEAYSPLDRYLMGFLPPDQVEPAYPFGMYYVAGVPSFFSTRLPQPGISFDGVRRDVRIDELIQAEGRRTPDSTVSQRRFRFAFVLITAAGQQPSSADITQVDTYRTAFEPFYQQATGNLAFADTDLRNALRLSVFPAAGVIAGRTATAAIQLDTAPTAPLVVKLSTQNGIASVPASVTIPARATAATFQIAANRIGVEEVSATPADSRYQTDYARIQVAPTSALRVAVVSGDAQSNSGAGPLPQPVTVRVTDINELPYPGVRVQATATGSVTPEIAITDASGQASFRWTPGTTPNAQLRISVDGAPDAGAAAVSATGSKVKAAGVLNAASLAVAAAPGMRGSIYGENLGGASATVTLGDRVLAVTGSDGDSRLDFYIPADVPLGPTTLVITNEMGRSAPVAVNVTAVAPGIYADGFDQPVHAGDAITISGTGFGASPQDAQVTIGGEAAAAQWVRPAPGLLGVVQFGVRVPEDLAAGPQPLFVSIQNIRSNQVQLGLE